MRDRIGGLEAATRRAAGLACWRGPVVPEPVGGGITNTNFSVVDRGRRYFVRIGDDIPVHGIVRANDQFPQDLSRRLIEAYFERPCDDGLARRFAAMTAASLLRETMWSMVSEIHSTLDFDYAAYTAENLARFEKALGAFEEMDDA